MKKRLSFLLLCLAAVATACQGSADAAVARGHYDSIAPEYKSYVANDAALTAEQKSRRDRNVEAWNIWVKSLEAKK